MKRNLWESVSKPSRHLERGEYISVGDKLRMVTRVENIRGLVHISFEGSPSPKLINAESYITAFKGVKAE